MMGNTIMYLAKSDLCWVSDDQDNEAQNSIPHYGGVQYPYHRLDSYSTTISWNEDIACA
jgi:hypothetical protein